MAVLYPLMEAAENQPIVDGHRLWSRKDPNSSTFWYPGEWHSGPAHPDLLLALESVEQARILQIEYSYKKIQPKPIVVGSGTTLRAVKVTYV
jgi:hypothetical protein